MGNWDESAHPRVPGGKTTGGQFVEKSSGGSTPFRGRRPAGGKNYEVHGSLDLDNADKERFLNALDGNARNYLEKAQYWEDQRLAPPVEYLFKDGEPYSYFQGGLNDPNKFDIGDDYGGVGYDYSMLGKNPYCVFFLGSAGPGGGTAALVEAIRDALKPSKGATGFYLESAKSAEGFYKKLGMHQIGRSWQYYYTADEMRLIVDEWDGKND